MNGTDDTAGTYKTLEDGSATLEKESINQLAARAVARGGDLFDTLRAACMHPVRHYHLPVGLLQPGDPADFIRVADLEQFQVLETWIDGVKVVENGETLLEQISVDAPNHFLAEPVKAENFRLFHEYYCPNLRVIRVWDGEIVTGEEEDSVSEMRDGQYMPDTVKDLLYITVVNRYESGAIPALGFVRGFGLKKGAIAGSVAHDSHNIVAVGTSDEALATVVNAVIAARGGVAATDGDGNTHLLPLPIAGLMSLQNGRELARDYAELDAWVKSSLGCVLKAPFMTLSFLALPVIPKLKMTDKGLFDVARFDYVPVEKAFGEAGYSGG